MTDATKLFKIKSSLTAACKAVKPCCSCLQRDNTQLQQCSLEDFKVHRILGTGSFGRVSLAQHNATGQICAIKALSKEQILKNQQARSCILLLPLSPVSTNDPGMPFFDCADAFFLTASG